MATVNFSVPEKTKRAFDETFKSEKKSAIVTQLMDQAIEERRRAQRHAAAVDALPEPAAKLRGAVLLLGLLWSG